VGGGTGVQYLGGGPLKRHLVQGSDESCLIPAALLLVRRRSRVRDAGELSRGESGVSLGRGRSLEHARAAPRWWTPWLLVQPSSPGRVAEPRSRRCSRFWGTALALLLPAATLPAVVVAARAATIAAVVAGEAAASGVGDSTAAGAACSVEHHLGCHVAFVGKAELLQDKLFAGGGEVRQRVRIGDVVGGAGEARVEATQEVEDKLRVGDDAADITKRVGGGLHLLGIVVDGGVALGHRVELMAQEDGARGLVGLEEAPDGQLEGTRGLIWRRRQAEDIWPDRAKEPTANAGVSNVPGRVGGTSLLRDMGKEAEFPTERCEERFPLVEVGPLQLQGH
jgi:hypothetical protein